MHMYALLLQEQHVMVLYTPVDIVGLDKLGTS